MPPLYAGAGSLSEHYARLDRPDGALGPVDQWPRELVDALRLVLFTSFPAAVFWGPRGHVLYNEAFIGLLGDKHPHALGAPLAEVFPEAMDFIGPIFDSVTTTGNARYLEHASVPLDRHGSLEECYFTFSYSAVVDDAGRVLGVLDIASETTDAVIARRRLELLTRLRDAVAALDDPADVLARAVELLLADSADFAGVEILAGETLPETVVHDDAGVSVRLPLAMTPTDVETGCLLLRINPLLRLDDTFTAFLRVVAVAISVALARARLLTAERRDADDERAISHALQVSLLGSPTTGDAVQIAVRYLPSADRAWVGGDWHDTFRDPAGRLILAIGDVAGHDRNAAVAMAQARTLVRGASYALGAAGPAQVLGVVDEALIGLEVGALATAVVGSLVTHPHQRASGETTFTWSNAGHPPPALIAPDGSARLLRTTPELLLGLEQGVGRTDHSQVIAPGSTLVLYTDGLVERRGESLGDGFDRLLAALAASAGADPHTLADRLVTELAPHPEDDIAVLVLHHEPAAEPVVASTVVGTVSTTAATAATTASIEAGLGGRP